MPELPEVENAVRALHAAGLPGQRILSIQVYWRSIVAGTPPAVLRQRLLKRKLLDITRRGKFILFHFSGGETVLIHLRMTGQFALQAPQTPRDQHTHLTLQLSGGQELRYRDARKFGRWQVTRAPQAILQRLGPEPLAKAFTPRVFAQRLNGRRRMLKTLLLDQAFLAGLGNIYADEALWLAGLHPQRRADTLTPPETLALYRAIRQTLRRGIRHGGTTLGRGAGHYASLNSRRGRHQDYLRVYRRSGQACERCQSPIRRVIIGQRSTHFCPTCQRLERRGPHQRTISKKIKSCLSSI